MQVIRKFRFSGNFLLVNCANNAIPMITVPISSLTLLNLKSSPYPLPVTIWNHKNLFKTLDFPKRYMKWYQKAHGSRENEEIWRTSVTDSSRTCLMAWGSRRLAFFGPFAAPLVIVSSSRASSASSVRAWSPSPLWTGLASVGFQFIKMGWTSLGLFFS